MPAAAAARLAVLATLCMCKVSPVCVGVAASARAPSGVACPATPCWPRPLTCARLLLSVVWRDALPWLPRSLSRLARPPLLVCRTHLPPLSAAALHRPRPLGRVCRRWLLCFVVRLISSRPVLVRADLLVLTFPFCGHQLCSELTVPPSPASPLLQSTHPLVGEIPRSQNSSRRAWRCRRRGTCGGLCMYSYPCPITIHASVSNCSLHAVPVVLEMDPHSQQRQFTIYGGPTHNELGAVHTNV